MKHRTVYDHAWLARGAEALCELMYTVSDDLSTSILAVGELSCTILSDFGTYSRRHRLCSNARIKMSDVGCDAQCCTRRPAWQWHHRHTFDARGDRQVCRRDPLPNRGALPPEVKAFNAELRNLMAEHVREVNRNIGFRPPCTIPGFLRLAKKWCQDRNLRVSPSDKDGVLALRRSTAVNAMILSKLRAVHTACMPTLLSRWRWVMPSGPSCVVNRMRRLGDEWTTWVRECCVAMNNSKQ